MEKCHKNSKIIPVNVLYKSNRQSTFPTGGSKDFSVSIFLSEFVSLKTIITYRFKYFRFRKSLA